MTYTEAKKEINSRIKSRIELARKYDLEVPDYIEALEMAVEALEKQTPQKAIEDTARICQSCLGFVGYLYNHCQNCGQALDWSEE